jgi:hypothetical protein
MFLERGMKNATKETETTKTKTPETTNSITSI